MEYMRQLRQRVGHFLLIMMGAAVLILDEQERLLLLRRTDNDCWGIPGGALEPGERLEETARRETQEETGLSVEDLQLFGVFSGPELFYEYPNGDQVHNVTVVYLARGVEGKIKLAVEEHSQSAYFALDDLPARISPPIQPILRKLAEEYSSAGRASQEERK